MWLTFIYGVVISFVLAVIFFSVWRKNVCNCISVSGLIWVIALAIYLTVKIPYIWLIFLVAIPIQILAIVWFVFVKIKRVRKAKLNNAAAGKAAATFIIHYFQNQFLLK